MDAQNAVPQGGRDVASIKCNQLIHHVQQFKKRSKTMRNSNSVPRFLLKGMMGLVTLFLIAGLAFGQDFTNTGAFNNRGATLTVKGAFTNSGSGTVDNNADGRINIDGTFDQNASASNFATDSGIVAFRAGTAQTITGSVRNTQYGAIIISGSATKSLGSRLSVKDTVQMGSGSTLAVNGKQLSVLGASAFTGSGTLSASGSTDSVNYAGDVDQSVYGATYGNLVTSGASAARSKTAIGNIVVTGSLANGTNHTLDFGTYSFNGTGATFNNSATLQSAGAVTLTSGATINGTFVFNAATGTQSIPDASFANLTFSGGSGATGQKNLSSGTTSVSGTYSVAGANRNYGTGTFQYNGTNQSVLAESYNNLTLSGTGLGDVKTAAGALTVGGAFSNLLGTTNVSTYSLSITGSKTNTGKMQFAGGSNGVVFSDGTVEYNGTTTDAAQQSIALGTYASLLFSNNSPKQIGGGQVRTTSGLTISSGVTANVLNTGTLQVDGSLSNAGTVNNSGTIQVGP
jgi:fibronectin-binding autotransporter adhesin